VWTSTTKRKTIYNKAPRRRQLNPKSHGTNNVSFKLSCNHSLKLSSSRTFTLLLNLFFSISLFIGLPTFVAPQWLKYNPFIFPTDISRAALVTQSNLFRFRLNLWMVLSFVHTIPGRDWSAHNGQNTEFICSIKLDSTLLMILYAVRLKLIPEYTEGSYRMDLKRCRQISQAYSKNSAICL
jgi:hypothetical protein